MAASVGVGRLVKIPHSAWSRNCAAPKSCSRISQTAVQQKRSTVKLPAALPAGEARVELVEAGIADEGKQDVVFSRRWALFVLPLAPVALGSILASPSIAQEVSGSDVERAEILDSNSRIVELRTLSGCGLGVATYPDFVYNAEGGGGRGRTRELLDGRTYVRFDTEKLYIPPVSFGTTSIMGLPLPPGLKIEVVPKILEGYVEHDTGKVELNFLANFYFTAGPLYHAPPLVVNTTLTTESARGVFRAGRGQRLDSSGNLKLVGVARLTPVKDLFLSTFLTLPTDCLAELSANLSFL